MRIKISFTKNSQEVPNNLSHFNSYIHRCLGRDNKFHDGYSDYSCTGMLGGVEVNGRRNIDFSEGGHILFSSMDMEIMSTFVMGMLGNTEYGFGMKFLKFEYIEDTFYSGDNLVILAGPGLLLKGSEGNYLTPEQPNFKELLEEQVIRKFSKINPNLDFSDLSISYRKFKVRNYYSKHIKNTSTNMVLSIKTNRSVMEYLYNYGLGQSTGSGFGNLEYYDRSSK